MPNAEALWKEPTIAAGGSTGASEGNHHDLLLLDDLIGMDDVKDYQPRQSILRCNPGLTPT